MEVRCGAVRCGGGSAPRFSFGKVGGDALAHDEMAVCCGGVGVNSEREETGERLQRRLMEMENELGWKILFGSRSHDYTRTHTHTHTHTHTPSHRFFIFSQHHGELPVSRRCPGC